LKMESTDQETKGRRIATKVVILKESLLKGFYWGKT
jgi:hypothetical protein